MYCRKNQVLGDYIKLKVGMDLIKSCNQFAIFLKRHALAFSYGINSFSSMSGHMNAMSQ